MYFLCETKKQQRNPKEVVPVYFLSEKKETLKGSYLHLCTSCVKQRDPKEVVPVYFLSEAKKA